MADNMIYTGVSNSPINPVMDKVYKSPMDNIRFGAEDANVAKYVAYGNTEDSALYLESSYTTAVSKADAEYAFQRGMLIIKNGTNYLVPVSMIGTNIVTVGGSTSSATLTEWAVSDN